MRDPGNLYRKNANGRYEPITVDGIVSEAMLALKEGGLSITHWALRLLAVSLADSLGESNYLTVNVKPADSFRWLTVTLSRRGVLVPPEIKATKARQPAAE